MLKCEGKGQSMKTLHGKHHEENDWDHNVEDVVVDAVVR